MRPASLASNVVRFPGPRAASSPSRDQRGLLDTVYTSGVLLVAKSPACDRACASGARCTSCASMRPSAAWAGPTPSASGCATASLARVPGSARRGIFVAPFGELSEPRLVADLARRAEARGFDGFFVWDHVHYRAPVRAIADPWVTLAAVATATERLTIGPLVTPLPRRRPQVVAQHTTTLDRLSQGRVVLGLGLVPGFADVNH